MASVEAVQGLPSTYDGITPVKEFIEAKNETYRQNTFILSN